jgi:RsiW-degrading membrane proteinase PrsW (M82 family)
LAFVFEKILVLISDNLLYRAFVVAASTEEALRIILIFIFARNYKSDSLYEYLRSAISISIGFSSLENFAYVCYYFKGLETALERLYTAVPLHLLLGIVMASLLYRFKVSGRRFYLLLSFLVPVLFHGLYDYFCFTGYVIYAVLVLLVLFLFSFNLINKYFTFSVEERVQ